MAEKDKFLGTKYSYMMAKLYEFNVGVHNIAQVVYDEQKKYNEKLTMAYCMQAVEKVLAKREVQHGMLVALFLDEQAQCKNMPYPLQYIIEDDEPSFGADETLAKTVLNVYGSIADSNWGYLDKTKPGIIGELNDGQKNGGRVTTFLDDMVAAVAAGAEGIVAHNKMTPEFE